MALTQEAQEAKSRHRRETRDRLSLELPKGTNAVYRQLAAKLGTNVTKLIQAAVEEYARNHETDIPTFPQPEGTCLTERELLLLERFDCLSEKAQKDFIRLLGSFINPFAAQNDDDADEEPAT